MPTLEERVAYIEGQMAEQSHVFVALKESLARLDQRMEGRFNALDQRMDGVALKESVARLDLRMDALEEKISRQFLWMVGIQITILMAVLGAVLSRAS